MGKQYMTFADAPTQRCDKCINAVLRDLRLVEKGDWILDPESNNSTAWHWSWPVMAEGAEAGGMQFLLAACDKMFRRVPYSGKE